MPQDVRNQSHRLGKPDTTHSAPRPQNVLSVGESKELISLREAVLRTAGIRVFSTTDMEEACGRIRNSDFGLMLLCFSLDEPVREKLASFFRQCHPEGRIISISNKQVSEDTVFYGDVVFDALEGAEALIETVRRELAQP